MQAIARRFAIALAVGVFHLALAFPVQAQVNTGASGTDSYDDFWKALAGQVAEPTDGDPAWIIDPADQHTNWVEPPAGSRWITRTSGWELDAPDDIWTTYYMSFVVGSPETFSLAGRWATDNNALMFLNGTQVFTSGFTSFKSLTDFELSSGFRDGSNILSVQVYNGTASVNPSGLLMADVTATVPEPTSIMLLGTGLLGLAAIGRRKREDELED